MVHGSPLHLAEQVLALVAAEGDLRVAVVAQVERELVLRERAAVLQVLHDVEARAHGEVAEAEAEDAVELRGHEGLVRLARGADEARLRARVPEAELVLVEVALNLARAEGDGGVAVLHLHPGTGEVEGNFYED